MLSVRDLKCIDRQWIQVLSYRVSNFENTSQQCHTQCHPPEVALTLCSCSWCLFAERVGHSFCSVYLGTTEPPPLSLLAPLADERHNQIPQWRSSTDKIITYIYTMETFFLFKIIINDLVSSLWFIWIPMHDGMGLRPLQNFVNISVKCVDVWFWRKEMVPALKG